VWDRQEVNSKGGVKEICLIWEMEKGSKAWGQTGVPASGVRGRGGDKAGSGKADSGPALAHNLSWPEGDKEGVGGREPWDFI